MSSFKDLILRAKDSDPLAVTELMDRYEPLLLKEAIVDGETDIDLLQELWLTMFKCVQSFDTEKIF